jgi:hypothetical protein
MNKEQRELLDEVYDDYWNSNPDADKIFQYEGSTFVTRRMTKDEFVDMVKTDEEYGRRWGLRIEERELSEDERYNLLTQQMTKLRAIRDEDYINYNIPTKLITITYNDKTIDDIHYLNCGDWIENNSYIIYNKHEFKVKNHKL